VHRPFSSNDGPQPWRHDETRLRNLRIAYTARQHRFDPAIAVPFICECSDARCEELVRLTLGEYTAARDAGGEYIVAPGHQVDNAQIIRVKDSVWLYRAASPE
jgi:hypothetical protein